MRQTEGERDAHQFATDTLQKKTPFVYSAGVCGDPNSVRTKAYDSYKYIHANIKGDPWKMIILWTWVRNRVSSQKVQQIFFFLLHGKKNYLQDSWLKLWISFITVFRYEIMTSIFLDWWPKTIVATKIKNCHVFGKNSKTNCKIPYFRISWILS